MSARPSSLVVIGASAGGIEPLKVIAAGLPPDLAAAVAIVLHVLPTGESRLPAILTGAVDHVLPLREIGAAVIDFVGVPA